jgi:hypothetical protein
VFVTGLGATIAYTGAGAPLWTNHGLAAALTLDQSDNVFVTGSWGTLAYTGAGTVLWTNGLGGNSLAVDHNGNVFVTGSSATIAYSGAGVPLWTNRYGSGSANAVAVDRSGNVFVTGDGLTTIAYSGAGAPLWTNRYDGPGSTDDRAYMIAVDKNGNVFVTGYSYTNPTGYDYVTIAYSAAGVALWTNYYNGPGNYLDQAYALAVDDSGNVFVTGESAGFATVAYSGAGVSLWTNRYNGPLNGRDIPRAIAVDRFGNVFVAGTSFEPGGLSPPSRYATVAYSGAGVPLWTNLYSGLGLYNVAQAIAVDSNGNVFVTGWSDDSSAIDYATIAYSGAGVPLWTNRHQSGSANAVAVDRSGNVFVTGDGLTTIAYSGAGVPLWTNRYGSGSANAVVVDRSGNVFVTGYSGGDLTTIAYSGAGIPLWTNTYKGGTATGLAVDGNGNVYVAGFSYVFTGSSYVGFDYVTIAYSAAGTALWTNRYNGPANGEDRPWSSKCIAVGPDGAVYVTGSSDGNNGRRVTTDYATVKYVLLPRLAIQPLAAGSSTVNLTLTGAPESSWSIERASWINGLWIPLGRSLIGTNGVGRYEDAHPPIEGAYYRAAQP